MGECHRPRHIKVEQELSPTLRLEIIADTSVEAMIAVPREVGNAVIESVCGTISRRIKLCIGEVDEDNESSLLALESRLSTRCLLSAEPLCHRPTFGCHGQLFCSCALLGSRSYLFLCHCLPNSGTITHIALSVICLPPMGMLVTSQLHRYLGTVRQRDSLLHPFLCWDSKGNDCSKNEAKQKQFSHIH